MHDQGSQMPSKYSTGMWFMWCPKHGKYEVETEALNCLTRQYLTRHPGIVDQIFGREGVTGVLREDNPETHRRV
jgi:hypothetical protein